MLNDRIKNKIIIFFEKIHFFVFKVEMGKTTKVFVKNVGLIGLGNIGYTLFLLIVNIVAVRFLGAEEYGKYFLVVSISNFMIIPMSMALNQSLVKYLPEKTESLKKEELISSVFWSILFLCCFFSVIFLLLRSMFASIASVSVVIIIYAIINSFVSVLRAVAISVLRGLHLFKFQALLEVLYSLAIFISFFTILFFSKEKTFKVYTISVIVGLITVFFVVFFAYRKSFSPFFFKKQVFQLALRYSLVMVFGYLCWFVISNIDRFLLNKYLDLGSVGIFAVYFASSTSVIGRALSFFLNVFFPTVSAISDKVAVNNKLKKVFLISFVPLFILNCIVMYLMLLVYGKNYPIVWLWIVCFSASSVLNAYVQTIINLIQSQGISGASFLGKHSFVGAFLSFILNYILIKTIGVPGAAISALLISVYFLLNFHSYFKKENSVAK